MTATIPFGAQALGQIGVMPMQTLGALSGLCAVHLIDRRTGAAHRINGRALTVFTRSPAEATAELLAGRDPAHWETRIDRIEPSHRSERHP